MADPKRPGRPPIGDRDHPAARVNVRVHPAQYDLAFATAERHGISIPEVLRRGLKQYLTDDPDDE